MGQIFAFVTASVVRSNGAEEHGWIDTWWSRTELQEARNYAPPVVNLPEDDEDLAEYVRDAIGENLGVYFDNGDGTFYAEDAHQDVKTGDHWSYAMHFKRKYLGPNGWTETDWHPVADGGITL
ncbi:hypothetical protein [Streptomyces sp. CBMA29]|uniref:hypothetical protein n=1 Tax=Streptomyces sp. CBMA29 TaxID=1896314 RepID=UPI0016620724|nr:hypothetical protein [Streptomyces sp. CBMA29]MBD0739815.1 hypothetical protein [Streptomyces sp. CBMA29]